MKPLLFAGLALVMAVPVWSQPRGNQPLPRDDRRAPADDMNNDDGFDDGGPQVDGPIQLQNPDRRNGQMGGNGDGRFPGDRSNGGIYLRPPVEAQPPVSMFADDRYLFVLRGDTLMQFDKRSLVLIKSVELPRTLTSTRISGLTPQVEPDGQLRSRTSPPLLRRNGATFNNGQGPTF